MDLKEFGNSINKIINERLTSPFYGTLAISWLIINWKIVYLTLFVDSDEIKGNKIDFIVNNYSDSSNILWYPLLASFILITIIPFLTYLAYWANLYFIDLRKNRKNKVEKNQLLTVEESAQIKLEIQSQKIRFNDLLKDKNDEITLLKEQINQLSNNQIDGKDKVEEKNKSTLDIIKEENEKIDDEVGFVKLLNDNALRNQIQGIISGIERYNKAGYYEGAKPDTLAKLRANNIIKRDDNGKDYFTEKGLAFLRYYYNNN